MNIDQIQDPATAFISRTDKRRRSPAQGQQSGHSDYQRYENLLRRVDEVYREVVNLRREHNQFVGSIMRQLSSLRDRRQQTVELSTRERQVREMRRAGQAEKHIAAELGVSVSTIKSYEHRARKKEQLRREQEEQTRQSLCKPCKPFSSRRGAMDA